MEKKCTKCKEVKWDNPRDPLESEFSFGSSWCKACRALPALIRARCLKEANALAYDETKIKTLDEEKTMFVKEWEEFWPKVDSNKYLLLFDFIQSCGLRISEALVVTPEDINFNRGSIVIKTLKQRDKKKEAAQVYGRPDVLKELQKLPAKEDERYFGMSYVAAYLAFKKALRKTSLNQRLGLHSLRYLCGSRLLTIPGVTALEAAKILRHAPDQAVTQGYMKISSGRLLQIFEEMWKGQTKIWEKK